MAEAAAIGIPPHVLFESYDHRMLYAAFRGEALRDVRWRKKSVWASWNTANFTRAKKLPDLAGLLRKMDPSPVMMTAKQLRGVIFGIAQTMGAKITRRKKG